MTNASTSGRDFSFQPTPSVEASRQRVRYVDCSICRADHSQYLFHKVGVRFVRCRSCGMVYTNPVGEPRPDWFDIDRSGQLETPGDRRLALEAFEQFLLGLEQRYVEVEKKPLTKTALIGRFLEDFSHSETARRIGLVLIPSTDQAFRRLQDDGDAAWATSRVDAGVQVIVLNELLEASSEPRVVLEHLAAKVSASAWLAVTYSNADSIPARFLRRNWPKFFDLKSCFLTTNNVCALLAEVGYSITGQFRYATRSRVGYIAERLVPNGAVGRLLATGPVANVPLRTLTGAHVALFRKAPSAEQFQEEKLSIIVPIFNEARYAAQVIESILAKDLKIEKEVVIVESNSTDGTREIVQSFANRPGVRVLLEERPQGKGHAVKTGLGAVTGSIVLIQDADFEYDLDDYDTLLEPILQHRSAFVLGSRSLGLDDWKVRRFEGNPVKRLALNAAQVVFAVTFNALYQQRITDVNTMFKVFRRECLEGLNLQSNGFDLDIELACKLVRNGNTPIEVPVNYVARGFAEGKKISFVRDAVPSYRALFRYRFGI